MNEIKNINELHGFLDIILGHRLYVVGAGDFGEYVGDYFSKTGISWEGYIDKKGQGRLNNMPICGYDAVKDNKDAYFIISSVHYSDTMATELQKNGIHSSKIAVIRERKLFDQMCMEADLPQHGSYYSSSGGELNADKTFMVMERSQIYEGLFCDFLWYLRGCKYAEDKGLIPIIDDRYYVRLSYQNLDKLGTENAWEYYFKQLGGYDLSEIGTSKNVRHYNLDDSANMKIIGAGVVEFDHLTKDELLTWKALINRYMHLSEDCEKRVSEAYNSFTQKTGGKRVIGVSVREGYMVGVDAKLSHNSVRNQPPMEVFMDKLKKKMDESNYEFIFVACQSTDTINMFKERFGDKVIYTNRSRKSMNEIKKLESDWSNSYKWFDDRVEITKEYLVEIYMLSRCDSLLCGWTHGNIAAYLLKDGEFDEMIVYNQGNSIW